MSFERPPRSEENRMKQKLLLAALISFAPLACSDEDDDPRSEFVGSGFAVVDWTIEGTKSSDLCSELGADRITVSVSTASGAFVGEFEQDCESFATSIELLPGTYIADAFLVDAGGAPRTTTLPLDQFSIFGNDELILPIDFPFDSFF
jgi:hypothetical protein